MQLVLQTNWRQARRTLPPQVSIPWRFQSRIDPASDAPFAWLKHPLSRDEYIQVVRDSDVALFLHDGRAYYSRCSGVLVDMLAAGIPVLVPAGSWLAVRQLWAMPGLHG